MFLNRLAEVALDFLQQPVLARPTLLGPPRVEPTLERGIDLEHEPAAGATSHVPNVT